MYCGLPGQNFGWASHRPTLQRPHGLTSSPYILACYRNTSCIVSVCIFTGEYNAKIQQAQWSFRKAGTMETLYINIVHKVGY